MIRFPFVAAALLGLAGLAGLAGWPAIAADDSVRVYTNADLEALAPLPTQDRPIARHDETEWSRVEAWLEREYARIDAERERRHELELAEIEAEETEVCCGTSHRSIWPLWPIVAGPRPADHPRPARRVEAPAGPAAGSSRAVPQRDPRLGARRAARITLPAPIRR